MKLIVFYREKITPRGQTEHLVNCKCLFFFCYFILFGSPEKKINMFKTLSLEFRNMQTQNCVPIQCTVWPRDVVCSLSAS